jgi:hypothetical protein
LGFAPGNAENLHEPTSCSCRGAYFDAMMCRMPWER